MAETRSRKLNEEDHISGLPDDLLLQILSKLNVLEAVRTSLVSTRWVNLWTFNSTSLNINASGFIPDAEMLVSKKNNRINSQRFINTSNKILTKHRAQTINQLSIAYPLCDHQKVDAWINTAAKKQVKSLKLDFKPCRRNNPYVLLSLGSTTFSSLITLSLSFASLTSHVIESFLSNSPNLEELSVKETHACLNHLKINGASMKLKRLELIDNDIGCLQLSAPKLESFNFRSLTYSGTRISFQNTPLLTRFSYDEWDTFNTRCDYCTILPQLETLALTLSSDLYVAVDIPCFPSLNNLKQMHLTFGIDPKEGLPLFFRLFKAAHSLCKLSLEVKSRIRPELILEYTGECLDHKFVKEVEIDGFNGHEGELDLLICIAKSCSSLQRIRLHPNPFRDDKRFFDLEDVKRVALELPCKLPQKELEILLEPKDPQTWKDRGLQDFQVRYVRKFY